VKKAAKRMLLINRVSIEFPPFFKTKINIPLFETANAFSKKNGFWNFPEKSETRIARSPYFPRSP
jgi:hypothetical protein